MSVRSVAAGVAAGMNGLRFRGAAERLDIGAVRRTARGADLDGERLGNS